MRQHLPFLAEASCVLSSSLDYRQTIRTAAQLAVPYLADWSVVDLFERDGVMTRVAVAFADPADAELEPLVSSCGGESMRLKGLAEVIRTGRALLWNAADPADQIARCTEDAPLHREVLSRIGMLSSVCVPLVARGQILGAWSLVSTRRSGRHYTADDVALAEALGSRTAISLDNARLYEDAQAARAHAMALARRASFLDHSSRLLTSSLDERTTYATIAELAVTSIADWCVIHTVQEDGSTRRAQTAWADAAQAAQALAFEPEALVDILSDGRSRLVSDAVMVVPLRARERVLGAITFVAIGERRFAAGDLSLAEDLASRAALAAENAHLYRHAQEANRSKDEFIATVSHELRTPMAALLLWAQLLKADRLDAAGRTRAVEANCSTGQAQAQLVEDLLDVTRISSGKLRLITHEAELMPIIRNAIDQVSHDAEARAIRLSFTIEDGLTTATCDPHRLRQILVNLLSNAIKFTPDAGRVWVEVRRAFDGIEVAVGDTGVGITKEFLPHVWDRFRQSSTETRRPNQGLGLGLTIVRHLVLLHGGAVRAESPGIGRGAIFTVLLPSEAAQRAPGVDPAPTPAPERPVLQDVRVLLVDDEPTILEVLTMALEAHGAVVTAARSAEEALARLRVEVPSVLVSDIAMPGEDGYALIRKARAMVPRLPAVAVTALARAEDRDAALAAGYQAHAAKPVDVEKLATVIAELSRQGTLERNRDDGSLAQPFVPENGVGCHATRDGGALHQ